LVYLCYRAESELLGPEMIAIASTSLWASTARIAIVVGVTIFSTVFLLGPPNRSNLG
jgi:hypothetical protein